MAFSSFGGLLAGDWYFAKSRKAVPRSLLFSDYNVYKNDVYHLGLRYPNDWSVREITPSVVVFEPPEGQGVEAGSQESVQEHAVLSIVSNESRAKTACEEDQRQCSFHANGIFGDRITTPETETIFFSRGTSDFTFTLYRYNCSDEVWEDYVAVFEEMGASIRFTSQTTLGCEEDADCALGIRLDECCSCPEAFAVSEIEANSAIVPFEVGEDYSSEKTIDCSGVDCSLCPDPNPIGAVCVSNRCRVKE